MAKLTFEQAKLELKKIEGAIAGLTAAGIEIPPVLQAQFEALTKQLTSNASAQVAELFSNTIAVKLNGEGNEELKATFAKAIGTGAGVRLKVSVNAEGNICFEAAGSAGGGGTSSSQVGVVRSTSAFNHWVVKNLTDGTEAEFDAANQALKHLLNNGQNPLNLGAEFGSGNSAVRVLTNILPKNPDFSKFYEVVGSKVEKAEKVTEPTSDEPKA